MESYDAEKQVEVQTFGDYEDRETSEGDVTFDFPESMNKREIKKFQKDFFSWEGYDGLENHGWVDSDRRSLVSGGFEIEEVQNEQSDLRSFLANDLITDWLKQPERALLNFESQDSENKAQSTFAATLGGKIESSVEFSFNCYIEPDDSHDRHNFSTLSFFIYLDIPDPGLPISAYEAACSLANEATCDGYFFAHLEALRNEKNEVLYLRVKAFLPVTEKMDIGIIDSLFDECMKMAIQVWNPILKLSQAFTDGYEVMGIEERGVEVGRNTDEPTDLRTRVRAMLENAASKSDIAKMIFESMPNSPSNEVIQKFQELAGLTPSGASTYYYKIKGSTKR